MCTDTGCACYSLKIVFPVLLPVKIPFTLQRTFYKEISGMEEKKALESAFPHACAAYFFSLYRVSRSPRQSGASNLRRAGAATDGGNCLTQHLIVELRPGAVRVVIDGSVGSDPKVPRRFHRVNVCAEEQELPAILLPSAARSSASPGRCCKTGSHSPFRPW